MYLWKMRFVNHVRSHIEGGSKPRALWAGLLAATLAAALAPTAAQGESAIGAVVPGTMGQGPVGTCFWSQPTSNVGAIDELDYPVAGTNTGAPDTNVVYYYTSFRLPAGATVTLHGQYPHARFFSLTTYVVKGEVPGYPSTSIYDEQINPDTGSVNPFRPGERRDARNRSYTITISGQTPPEIPAANTLYAGQPGTTGETQRVEMIMRIYRPDRDLEANGGVPLPAPTVNPREGSPIGEEAAACAALEDESGVSSLAAKGMPVSTYLSLRELAPAPHPADDPIVWERFFNTQRLVEPFLRGAGELYEKLIGLLPQEVTSGLYATPSNAYISAYVDRTIGPNTEGHNILVLHAKMPTHPETYEHNPVNQSGSSQVRYWSLCTTGAVAEPPMLPADSACLFDQEVPTNTNDEYTIVVSLPEDRPRNARPGCGVAWMNWGTAGDALEGEYERDRRATLDVLVMRNQLSSPAFEQSIQNVTVPGTEESVMGAYYPHGTYMTRQGFEARKCWSAGA
jgi:hypothetical protein